MSAKGLGRGLSALFGDDPVIEEAVSSGSTLRVCDIEPNPGQPRRHFDPDALQVLAASIRENGLLPVSYTHLDVYKRQPPATAMLQCV